MGAILLDVILVIVLLGFLIIGLGRGLWATLGGALGFVVGLAAAFFAIPRVAEWVGEPVWRVVAVVAVAILLVIVGHAIGSAIGGRVGGLFRSPALRVFGSLIGGVLNLAVAAFAIAVLSFSLSAMGFPAVNQQLNQSRVVQTIDAGVPEPIEAWFAEVRSAVTASDIPEIAQLIAPNAAEAPSDTELSEAAESAAASVARVSGVAEQCGQSQTGSGFAVSDNRIVTNAHVLAGITAPTVEMPNGEVLPGRAVYFDPERDLAVLAVDSLESPSLEVSEPLSQGDSGYVMGYPAGGPFSAGAATVQGRDVSVVNNIYGGSPSELEVYQVNADVRQGNSGGPLVSQEGDVAGVVFARAVEGDSVGFAVTAAEAGEVLTSPESFTETVSTGQCVQR